MTTTMERFRTAMQPPQAVAFFRGLFERAGVRVLDTGEGFTCIHTGAAILFQPGIDEAALDFVVDVEEANVEALLADIADGALDDREQYRIMTHLAAPAARGAFRRPAIRNRFLRELLFKIGRAEMLMHVRLVPPPGEQEAPGYTVMYVDGQTLVIDGLHGKVDHEYRLTVAHATEFQRRLLDARKKGRLRDWLAFARWYGKLRREVVAPVRA
ncbi:MAG: hypothetical protein HY873_10085 [Chloroflexi bacterium]|nr:hypothetical protein [Chloroflexota bacterium]